MDKILAIIPARGGSKRIPNKNIKLFHGKEIISYPISALLSVETITTVLVSTDSDRIKETALHYGASVPFMRSDKNADDFATTFDVISEVLEHFSGEFKYVCCLYPTSVFVTPEMLQSAIEQLKANVDATSIASVLEYSHPIQRSLSIHNDFLKSNTPEFYNSRSQDLAVNYHDAGQFYIFDAEVVKKEKRLITENCIPYIINPNAAQDIDSQDDWELAELKYNLLANKEKK